MFQQKTKEIHICFEKGIPDLTCVYFRHISTNPLLSVYSAHIRKIDPDVYVRVCSVPSAASPRYHGL